MRRVALITAIAAAVLVVTLLGVIVLGGRAQSTAVLLMRIATAAITTGATLLLAKSVPSIEPRRAWVPQLAAILQFVLAGIGITFLPALALWHWGHYPDFRSYEFGLVWMLPTIVAFVFCVTRGPTRGDQGRA